MRTEFFFLCVLQLALIPLLGAVRWQVVLLRLGYVQSLKSLGRIFWIGMALNQILPTAVGGDAFRAWIICRNGVRFAEATVSIIIERALLLGTLLAIIAIAGWGGSPLVPPALSALATICVVAGALTVALLAISGQRLVFESDRKFVVFIRDICIGSRKVLLSYQALPLIVLCFLTNLNFAIAGWWLGIALGLPVHLSAYITAISVATLASLMPVSIGGWGVREAATVALLGSLVGGDMALIYSLLFGAALVVSSLPGVLFLLWSPQPRVDEQSDSLLPIEQETI